MASIGTPFDFPAIMESKARTNKFTLDPDQHQVISGLNALIFSNQHPQDGKDNPGGVYIWGKVGRGKTFILDAFYDAAPVKKKRRVHFHYFFRELHQRIAAQNNDGQSITDVLSAQLGDCRLLCFDEFHLHDIGDAMLIKPLLDFIFQQKIMLVTTSNYPPDELLANPLYHQRFLPSIALIKQHMAVLALAGGQDYRSLGANDSTPFCEGVYLCPGNAEQRRECGLPEADGKPHSLEVGYRTLAVLSPASDVLHFSFAALCAAPTAVMDYLALCERCRCWVIEAVPALATQSPAAQQRFINVIDVLYDQNCRLYLVSEYPLATMTDGVELEDIQRTRSRLSQLKHYLTAVQQRPRA
ncbi:cell division protein ZapE [Serratia rubidaea]|uniref:cell division protein ZapE n=1 Tax=Serratia rubidaea TaxID=61652 RepID=UPI003D36A646